MIEIDNLEKKYGKNIVLKDVSIKFLEGKIYLIHGINGSGKSTLLKILSNVKSKTSGYINITSSISFLPDKYKLPYFLKVETFIKGVLKLYKLKINSKDILKRFNLENKLIGSLSKGNLQKLGLFLIFYNNSNYYLLDEPIDGLDDFAKKLFKEIIIEKINENKTVIISIHNKNFLNDLNTINYEIKDGILYERKKKKLQLSSSI